MTIADSTIGICTHCSHSNVGGACSQPITTTYGACYAENIGEDEPYKNINCSTAANGTITCTLTLDATLGTAATGGGATMTFTPS